MGIRGRMGRLMGLGPVSISDLASSLANAIEREKEIVLKGGPRDGDAWYMSPSKIGEDLTLHEINPNTESLKVMTYRCDYYDEARGAWVYVYVPRIRRGKHHLEED